MANMKDWLWPPIDDIQDARKAAHLGAACAFLVAGVTAAVTFFATRGMKLFPGLDASGFLDAGLFLVIGLFIYRYSRIAAIAGLLLYVGEQIMMMKMTGFRFSLIPILFTLQFIAGVRGTFDYHHMKKSEDPEVKAAELPPQIFPQAAQEEPKKKPLFLWMALFILLLAAAGAGYYFFLQKKQAVTFPGTVLFSKNAAVDSAPSSIPQKSPAVPMPGESTFKMKDGKRITGRVIMEDDVYYTVETSGGKQEIVIKEDIAPSA